MRLLIAIFSLMFVSLSVNAQDSEQTNNETDGEVRYITDDLYTYLHAGPGRNYRILGSVLAGTKVIQLQFDSENNFAEIIDDKQRTGWVDASFITQSESLREQLPELQESLKLTSSGLNEEKQSNDLLNQQIEDLRSRNNQLQSDLNALTASNNELKAKLQNQDKSEQMEWLTRGGIIALISVIIGVIIAYLPKKRRRNDQWM
ncbi:TIGR04211 family SH3 domain-containing protein [Aestuariibacter sp. AA17]|uniref:TIGR04211 family SH3 domain-containing protein n=1 Tax=Fluctibacter corallii TaxID=2984329 RepID=A0ABT3A7F7_9ALTE|nr:TIGR04211 family SH3 domain-containing protein [Aestuariibacter sp. AA17]MCV2884628.1 TIGR04211 family SH3 domain-containing protein [Aestuariibacter sp. AA17]